MSVRFIYFDLGKVLLDFSHDRGFTQIASAANCGATDVRKFFVDSGMSDRYDRGELTTADFHRAFCEETNSSITPDQLTHAWSDIFTVMPATLTLAANLKSAGYRIGILSNTCEAHWLFAVARFRILSQIFEPVLTSYDVGAMKPDAVIYESAAEAGRCRTCGDLLCG